MATHDLPTPTTTRIGEADAAGVSEDLASEDPEEPLTSAWLLEYEWGASHQLYALNLKMFRGIGFAILAEHLCKTYGFILIAVEENATGLILRNPGNLYLVCAEDKGPNPNPNPTPNWGTCTFSAPEVQVP